MSETSRHTSSLSQTEDGTGMPSFTLDLNTVQIIQRNTYTQYTTSVFDHADYETYLINYLLLDFNDGSQYQFLIKYPRIITDQGAALDRSNPVMEGIEGDVLLQAESGVSRPCLDGVPEIVDTIQEYQCTEYNCTGGNHTIGEECDCGTPGYSCIPAYEVCGWVTVNVWGCSGGATSGTGTTSPTGGNSNDPNNPDDDDDEPIETIAVIANWEKIEECMNTASLVENIQLTSAMIAWLQTNNSTIASNMYAMLIEYSCDAQAQEEIFEEINELIENPFIENTLDIFAVDELTNDCLLNVVRNEIIINLNTNIINAIRNGLGQENDYILAFRQNDIPNGNANAGTSMPSQTSINNGLYPIIFNFDNDYLTNNPTKLSLTATTIHEMVHAQLIYLYFKGELLQKYPDFADLKNKFDIFITNRSEVNRIALENSMHVSMVDLIGTMSYALFKYAKDNRMDNVTHEYCKDVTKGTFSGTPAMNEITPDTSLQNDYILKAQNEQNNTSDAKGKDC